MRVQLLFFPGCPNVDATRAALRAALAADRLDLPIEEIDVEDPRAPEWARGWGSPTILIDGKDIYDQASSGASACRLYAHGSPSVDVIRARLAGARNPNGRRIALPMIGAISAALAASACCVVPAVLAVVGVSGVGFASRFAPYRAYFLIASAVALAAGFWFAYRRQTDDCGCEVPRRRRAARVGLWMTTLLTVILAAYPLLGNDSATAGSSEAEARATLILKVTDMDCKECTSTIANRIKQVAGVVSATVEFPSGKAIVRYDGRDGTSSAAIKAVEDAGYRAEVQP